VECYEPFSCKSGAVIKRAEGLSNFRGERSPEKGRSEIELELELEDGTRIATPPIPADLALGLLARVACYG
jgi:hypothetical protein